MESVFARATTEPCQVCLDLARDEKLQREMVMPLPTRGPLNLDGGKCCFDCQSAESLVRFGAVPTFLMARIAVGTERRETLRMPEGMAQLMGMCSKGLVRPADITQLEQHLDWLDGILPSQENVDGS